MRVMWPHQEFWSLQRRARRLSEAMTSLRYLMVACVPVSLRIFGERLFIAWANLIIGRAQKQVYLSVWGRKQVKLKSSRKRNPRGLSLVYRINYWATLLESALTELTGLFFINKKKKRLTQWLNSFIICCKTKHVSHLWDRGFRRKKPVWSCVEYFDRAFRLFRRN